jgi:hypothetical protein
LRGIPRLLSNTELAENIIELIFIGNLAGDLTEIMQGAADVEA